MTHYQSTVDAVAPSFKGEKRKKKRKSQPKHNGSIKKHEILILVSSPENRD